MHSIITPLSFSIHETHKFWASHGVADAIAAMEATETWTVDGHEEVEQILIDLQQKLEGADKDSLAESIAKVSACTLNFMGYLKSGRALLFFRWLSDIDPRIASVLIMEARASGSDFGVLLIERLRVLERQHVLSRIFSPERIAFVLESMENLDGE